MGVLAPIPLVERIFNLTSNAFEESLALGAGVLREAGLLLLTRPRFGHLCPDLLPAVIHNRTNFSHLCLGKACSHPRTTGD